MLHMAESLKLTLRLASITGAHDGRLQRQRARAPPFLEPDAIAQTYLQIHDQPRSAWTWEIELRPWTETF